MSAQTLYSVHNAARLLCAFQAADSELGVTELARRLGLAKSVVYRMLRTLMVEGLIEQDVETGGYRLGIKLWELGCLVSSHAELHRAATIVVDELHNRTGDSVHVAVLDGVEVVYVERREAQRTLDSLGEVGHRNYAHSTATGKVLLAFLPPAELDRRLARAQLARQTPHTITDPDRLRRELGRVREQGYAENVNESRLELSSVAAPIRGEGGAVVAAVSIVAASARLAGETRRRYTAAALTTAAEISERLGYRPARVAAANGPRA
ncbi:MAG TPA: IclR family transcriptional regulator [Candidatus Binatia bacterium]|jgi:DNA-binding IclR family transcriptional regulator|nr:IclR family transcriptional regulator [Candidatus Binatia bacterium]